MIVECSNCHAKYNVDENKIPDAGIKVKCHKCQSIIFIQRPSPTPEPVPQPEQSQEVPEPAQPPETPQPEMPSEPTTAASEPEEPPLPEAPIDQTEPSVPEPVPPEPEMPEQVREPGVIEREELPPESETPKPDMEFPSAPVQAPQEMSEEDKKWHERARRLAKALASDLVLYNQNKVEEGLREGTLAQLLGSEIRRSWEYYCQQIPKKVVDTTDYFKEQLNKIVGKGKEIFK